MQQLDLFTSTTQIDSAINETVAQLMVANTVKRSRQITTHTLLAPSTIATLLPIVDKRLTWQSVEYADVSVTSARMKTFRKNRKCVCCGIEGNVYTIEERVGSGNGRYLNLYAVSEDKVVEMTVDHTLPTGMAGCDVDHNRETMCFACNQAKSNRMTSVEIDCVLADVQKYAKSWVNIQLLTAILTLNKLMIGHPDIKQSKIMSTIANYSCMLRPNSKAMNNPVHLQAINDRIAVLKGETSVLPNVLPTPSKTYAPLWFDNIIVQIRMLLESSVNG